MPSEFATKADVEFAFDSLSIVAREAASLDSEVRLSIPNGETFWFASTQPGDCLAAISLFAAGVGGRRHAGRSRQGREAILGQERVYWAESLRGHIPPRGDVLI